MKKQFDILLTMNYRKNIKKFFILFLFFIVVGCSKPSKNYTKELRLEFEGVDIENLDIKNNFNVSCELDIDCMLVKSPHPCIDVSTINKANTRKSWDNYFRRKKTEFNKLNYNCPKIELNSKNSNPICQNGVCNITKKND